MKPHFDIIADKTSVCPCEMEFEFKTFFNVEGAEFDENGNLHILNGSDWSKATDDQVEKFIEFFKKI